MQGVEEVRENELNSKMNTHCGLRIRVSCDARFARFESVKMEALQTTRAVCRVKLLQRDLRLMKNNRGFRYGKCQRIILIGRDETPTTGGILAIIQTMAVCP